MNIHDFRNKKQIITHSKQIDRYEAERIGEDVFLSGEVVAYYIDEGYDIIAVPMSNIKEVSNSFIWYVTHCLVALNRDRDDIDFEDLLDFMFLYTEQFISKKFLAPNKDALRYMLDKAYETADFERCKTKRKFYFIKTLTKKEIRSVVMKFINRRKSTDTLIKIENAIEWLTIEGSVFITSSSIKDSIKSASDEDLSIRNIRKYMEIQRDDIDRHNRKVFGTDNFMSYKKMLSVHNIQEAMRVLNLEGDRLSQGKVARASGLHINTVHNLWLSDAVQDQLNKYNQIFKSVN
jgi:hypothetical protein